MHAVPLLHVDGVAIPATAQAEMEKERWMWAWLMPSAWLRVRKEAAACCAVMMLEEVSVECLCFFWMDYSDAACWFAN